MIKQTHLAIMKPIVSFRNTVIANLVSYRIPGKKKPGGLGSPRACVRRLAIPYFRTANCRTIIGAKRFHFRVRDGVGWFTLAMVTKQSGASSLGPVYFGPFFLDAALSPPRLLASVSSTLLRRRPFGLTPASWKSVRNAVFVLLSVKRLVSLSGLAFWLQAFLPCTFGLAPGFHPSPLGVIGSSLTGN